MGFFLKTCCKVNPTLINYEEPIGSVLLKEGDKIQIGTYGFFLSEEKYSHGRNKTKKPKKKNREATMTSLEPSTKKKQQMLQAPNLAL